MLKALVIDDRIGNINTLNKLLENYCPSLSVCGTATSVEEGVVLIHKLKPDIVFLDIEMNDGTGFDLLQKFKDLFFEVIFTTAYSQYAIQAFKENAIAYLLKPINIEDLQQAVLKAEKQIQLKKNIVQPRPAQENTITKISLPTQDGYLFVNYNDIIRCQASGSYSYFYFNGGQSIMVSMHLKECEKILPPHIFLRVHYSHIINLNFVNKYKRGRGGQIVMADNSVVDVSLANKELFLNAIKQFFISS